MRAPGAAGGRLVVAMSVENPCSPHDPARLFDLLTLIRTPGLGPVLANRLLDHFREDAAGALGASASELAGIEGVGAKRAEAIVARRSAARRAAQEELSLAEKQGVRFTARADVEYPPLLRGLRDAPPILSVKGSLDPQRDRYALAIVGSRSCTPYGTEQAGRFAARLAGAGLAIISGGARGIDAAAHEGALRVKERTIAVLGCGLANVYPPEHAELFERIVEEGGAVLSELPLSTPPVAENFPARNRIISGISLGALVIEAGKRSGALITARLATEEQGRETMALPGRVDSPASEGSLELIKSGGAALVAKPEDVLDTLEACARHAHGGTHAARYAPSPPSTPLDDERDVEAKPTRALPDDLTVSQRTLFEALVEPRSLDELVRTTGLDAGVVRADVTILEVRGVVTREGGRLARRR